MSRLLLFSAGTAAEKFTKTGLIDLVIFPSAKLVEIGDPSISYHITSNRLHLPDLPLNHIAACAWR